MTDLGPDQADVLAGRALSGVLQAREASYSIAMDLTEMLSGGSFREVPPPAYTIRFLVQAYRQVLLSPDRSPRALAERAVRHAEQAGRETQIRIASANPQRSGRWGRLPHGDACGFCTMLVSRGTVYRDQRTGGFRAHDRCRCTAVAAFGESPEVEAELERARTAALDRYVQASREPGDTLANLRRLQEV